MPQPNTMNSAVNPNDVKTLLDWIVVQKFEEKPGPDLATCDDEAIFHQDSFTNKKQVTMEVFKPVGFFDERTEEENVPNDTAQLGQQYTAAAVNFDKSVAIPKIFFDDDMHGVVKEMMKSFVVKAKRSQFNSAFGLFRGGFTTTLTADAATWFSDTHSTISGATVDNKSTLALTPTSLEGGINALLQQVDQNGDIMGHEARTLLVPPAMFREAVEITDSKQTPYSADNAVNWISSKYGIKILQSQYLGAAAGGSDTAWFLLGTEHKSYRWVRESLWSDLIDYIYSANNSYIYKGGFREVYGAVTYEASYGSTGVS